MGENFEYFLQVFAPEMEILSKFYEFSDLPILAAKMPLIPEIHAVSDAAA
jgi:hypothetical protein